jgi:hypothetical protein
MKRTSRMLLLVFALALCGLRAGVSMAQELPIEKSSSGSWSVEYAGQHFRIHSTVGVTVRFELLSPTQIKLSFVSESGTASGRVSVYWVEFQKYIYAGPIPAPEPWEGTLNTEGGFVDR